MPPAADRDDRPSSRRLGRGSLALVCALLAGAPAALAGVGVFDSAPAGKVVSVEDNYFQPRSVQVPLGNRVIWVWRGSNEHEVKFTKVPEGAKKGGCRTYKRGARKVRHACARIFDRPGIYRYVDRNWAGMKGSVTALPEQRPPAPQ